MPHHHCCFLRKLHIAGIPNRFPVGRRCGQGGQGHRALKPEMNSPFRYLFHDSRLPGPLSPLSPLRPLCPLQFSFRRHASADPRISSPPVAHKWPKSEKNSRIERNLSVYNDQLHIFTLLLFLNPALFKKTLRFMAMPLKTVSIKG